VRLALAAALAASVTAACGGKEPAPTPTPAPANRNLGDMMADTTWDTQVMREATGAANDVVRAAGDCEAVQALIAEAKARLEAAAPRLRTTAGRNSLDALRKQVAKVEELCPAGQ
jgi:hypothetical protein